MCQTVLDSFDFVVQLIKKVSRTVITLIFGIDIEQLILLNPAKSLHMGKLRGEEVCQPIVNELVFCLGVLSSIFPSQSGQIFFASLKSKSMFSEEACGSRTPEPVYRRGWGWRKNQTPLHQPHPWLLS
jgi:hypothetical protein